MTSEKLHDALNLLPADLIAGTDALRTKPKKPQVMKSVTVDTQGVEYPEPDKLPDPFHK